MKFLYRFLDVGALISSMYFQYVDSEVILVALIFFLTFTAGKIVANKISDKNNSIESVLGDPLIRALGLFLCGTCFILALTGVHDYKVKKEERRVHEANKILFANNFAQKNMLDIVFSELETDNCIPSSSYYVAKGVDTSRNDLNLLSGYYYLQMGDYLKARDYLAEAAKNNSLAKYYYGKTLYYGFGDSPKKNVGLDSIRAAAEEQVIDALFFLFSYNVASENNRGALEWYNKILVAESDTIHITLTNSELYDFGFDDSPKSSRVRSIIRKNISDWYRKKANCLEVLLSFCIENKNPSAAIKACEEYFSYYETSGRTEGFMNALKREIYYSTGNSIQAKKLEKSGVHYVKGLDFQDLNNGITQDFTKTLTYIIELL